MTDAIVIDIPSGCCRLTFKPWVMTGPTGCDTSPGIGFDIETSFITKIADDSIRSMIPGKFEFGSGVISREDATRLRDMLEIFLKNHAAGVKP